MAKRISDRERLLQYSYTADKEDLEAAVELFRTALRTRFTPKPRRSTNRGTAKKSDPPAVGNTKPSDGSGSEGKALAAG